MALWAVLWSLITQYVGAQSTPNPDTEAQACVLYQ